MFPSGCKWVVIHALLWALFGTSALACVELFSHRSLAETSGATPWDYSYLGANWDGVDASGHPWSCLVGRTQSPINLPLPTNARKLNSRLTTKFQYQTYDDTSYVWNNGKTLQVQNFTSPTIGGILVPTLGKTITDLLTPQALPSNAKLQNVFMPVAQFHFHTDSEHTMDGFSTNMEMHIVHASKPGEAGLKDCPNGVCYAVVGMMIKVVDGPDNKYLAPIFDAAPMTTGYAPLPASVKLNLDLILPRNKHYLTYRGSLTTPPCSEGLLWMVMTTPVKISFRQYQQFLNATGSHSCGASADHVDPANCTLSAWRKNNRLVQHQNTRQVFVA